MQTAEARRAAEIDAELVAAAQGPFPGLSTAATWSDQTRAGATSDLIGSSLRRGMEGATSDLTGSSLRQAGGEESQRNTLLFPGHNTSAGASQQGAAQAQTNQEYVRGNVDSYPPNQMR